MPPKNIKTAGIFFVVAAFVASAVLSAPATAAEQCGLSQTKFDELKAAQDNASLGYLEEIKAELMIRKQLLEEAVNCAVEETDGLKTILDNTRVDDPLMQNLKNRLADQLDGARNYFAIQKSRIGDLGLQGSKDFAKNLADWRDGNYKPAAENANSLILWINNQPLIQSGQARTNQISKIMTLLKVVNNDEIQNLWNDAQANFNDALKENQAAKNSLLGFAAPNESSAHIKSSLSYLSSTYKNFLDLIGLINK